MAVISVSIDCLLMGIPEVRLPSMDEAIAGLATDSAAGFLGRGAGAGARAGRPT